MLYEDGNQFVVSIELGNEAMCDEMHVASALEDIALEVERGSNNGIVKDVNGNTVGRYEVRE